MDIVSSLPIEVALEIFTYLNPTELAKCHAVCKQWRFFANINLLWKKHCERKRVHYNKYTFFSCNGGSLEPMCDWARTFAGYSVRRIQNWRNNFKYVHVISAWNRTVAAVWDGTLAFSEELQTVYLYELSSKIRYLQTLNLVAEEPVAALHLTPDHLIVRQDDMFTLYHKTDGLFILKGFLVYHNGSYIFTRHYYLSESSAYIRHCAIESALCILSDFCLYVYPLIGMSLHTYKVYDRNFFLSDHNRVYIATGDHTVTGFDSNCIFTDFDLASSTVVSFKSNRQFTVALVCKEDISGRYYLFKTYSYFGCRLKDFKTSRSFGFEVSSSGPRFASVANDKFGQRVFVTVYDVNKVDCSFTKYKIDLDIPESIAQAKVHFIGKELLYVMTRHDWGPYDMGYLLDLTSMKLLYEVELDLIGVVSIESRLAVYLSGEDIEIHLYNR